jgi:HD-GYP domain-containing protein (c-di-GMP phosphodiesterase class II)
LLNNQQQQLKKIRLDVISRWAITLILILLIGLSAWFNFKFFQVIWPSVILLSATIILNLAVYIIILQRQKIPPLSIYITKFVDIAIFTYVVWFTGSIDSPYYILYILMILLEGLSLERKYVNYDFILSALFYTILVLIVDVRILTERILVTPGLVVTIMARLTFMFLASWASLAYVKMLLAQRKELEDSNAENIRLYDKVKKFNQELEVKVKAATAELRKSVDENANLYMKYHGLFISMTKVIAALVTVRDPYYSSHASNVTDISLAILEELTLVRGFELPPELRGTLYLAGTLHDIGRAVLRDNTLKNTGTLSEEEWEDMKQAPVIGARIIESVKELEQVANGIRHHYERFDGKGYPDGLKGREIPLVSRILAVANAFDAMTSERSFRKRLSDNLALEEIQKNSGVQFDPVVVGAFVKAYEKGKIKKGQQP